MPAGRTDPRAVGNSNQPKSITTVRSIERAFDVLRLLALGPSGLAEIADGTGLAKSTCLRLLVTLERIGAVERNERGIYSIGTRIAELASFGDSTASLIMILRPHLANLAARTGEAAGFGIRVDNRVQHLIQEEAQHAVQVRDYTGHSVPMHVSSAGLAIMAHLPTGDVEAYLEDELERYTPRSVTDPEHILNRLESVRESGYVWAIGEFADGLAAVASPVFGPDGSVFGAISVHGPSYRFPGDRADDVERDILVAARRLSSQLSSQLSG